MRSWMHKSPYTATLQGAVRKSEPPPGLRVRPKCCRSPMRLWIDATVVRIAHAARVPTDRAGGGEATGCFSSPDAYMLGFTEKSVRLLARSEFFNLTYHP